MAVSQTAPNKVRLTLTVRAFLAFVALVSSPSFLALSLLALSYIMTAMNSYMGYRRCAESAYLLLFLGMATEPAALIMALIASLCPIPGRAKLIAWIIAGAGALAWLLAAILMPDNLWA